MVDRCPHPHFNLSCACAKLYAGEHTTTLEGVRRIWTSARETRLLLCSRKLTITTTPSEPLPGPLLYLQGFSEPLGEGHFGPFCCYLKGEQIVMANMAADVMGSAPGSFLPGVTLTSMAFILILFIMLLMLCSSCRRHSFDLQDSSQQDNPSSLIHVIKLKETQGGRDNPSHGQLTMDEIGETDAVSQGWSNPGPTRESLGPLFGNLRVQRIPIDPAARNQQVPAPLHPLRDVDSMLQSGPPLTALGHSDGSTETCQLNHVIKIPQDPTVSLQCLQRQKENIYETLTGDGGTMSVILPSAQATREEEFEDHLYHTAVEMEQLDKNMSPSGHALDPQNGNESYTVTPPSLQGEGEQSLADKQLNIVYAQVSKKKRNLEFPPPPSEPPPEDEHDREEWEGDPIPPIPQRNFSTEDCTSLV
ncbi:hypothetical protein GN956_G15805 [Arapaima gigas]